MQYFAMGRNAGHPESSVGGFFTEFLPSFYVLLFWSVCEEHFSGVVSFFFWRRRRRLESGQSKPETPVSSDSDIRENPRWASENPFRPASDLPCFVCFCFFLPSFTGFPFTAIGARSGAGCSDGRDVRESMPGIRASAASIRNWRLFRLYRVFTGLSFSS